MKAEILSPNLEGYQQAAQILIDGGLGVLRLNKLRNPYGFVVAVNEESWWQRMNAIKGRAEVQKPVIGTLSEQLTGLINMSGLDEELVRRLSAHSIFLLTSPGERIPEHMITRNESGESVAVMVFGHPQVHETMIGILEAVRKNSPEILLGGSSANRHGQPMITTIEYAYSELGNDVNFILTSPWPDNNEGALKTAAPMVRVTPSGVEEIIRGGELYRAVGKDLLDIGPRITLEAGREIPGDFLARLGLY